MASKRRPNLRQREGQIGVDGPVSADLNDVQKTPVQQGGSTPRTMTDPSYRNRGNTQLRILYAIFFSTFAICMICLGTLAALVTQNPISNEQEREYTFVYGPSSRLDQLTDRIKSISSWLDGAEPADTKRQVEEIEQYECIGWRPTRECSPKSMRDPSGDADCDATIPAGVSGFCEVQNRVTGEIKQFLPLHCDSIREDVSLSCGMFARLMKFNLLANEYVHDGNFSFEANRDALVQQNSMHLSSETTMSFERGILIVVYEKLLLGAYVNIRNLRAMGCELPVEMWYRSSETNISHPLIQVLTQQYGVYLREIVDERATSFYTKLHAIFYSAFDKVLLLDADNFPVRDPNYLFDSDAFHQTGALFWPDFWRPENTIFNIHERSLVWQYFGVPYVHMFEQESGQVLINRRMHQKALNVLMYFGFTMPRLHDELRLVWGDKDLFRLAWMKSHSHFHMVERPPGAAGSKHQLYDLFCGVTMVQHDPDGAIVFMHRNTEKLVPENDRLIWHHIQQFRQGADATNYIVRGANGGKVFPHFHRCFGKDANYDEFFLVTPISDYPFHQIEHRLRGFMHEGAAILNITTTAIPDPGITRPDT